MSSPPVLGIIGGMGPAATVRFFDSVVCKFPATRDQDHPRVILESDPSVPDRTEAILGQGPSPVPVIVRTGRNLIEAGATILAMPCVTAHHYYDEIQSGLKTPLIHMIKETAFFIRDHYPEKKFCLLATTGTHLSGLFQRHMADVDFVPVDQNIQEHFVMESVYGKNGVKAGHTDRSRPLILNACDFYLQKGAEGFIAGCTEIPLILTQDDLPVPLVDPMEVMAEVCVKRLTV